MKTKSWWKSFAEITDPALFEDELLCAVKYLATDVQARDGDEASINFVLLMAKCHLRDIVLAAAMGDATGRVELLALGLATAEDFKAADEPATDDHLAVLKATGEVLH